MNNFKFSAPSTKVPAFSQELSTINQSSSNMVKYSIITENNILLYKHMYPVPGLTLRPMGSPMRPAFTQSRPNLRAWSPTWPPR